MIANRVVSSGRHQSVVRVVLMKRDGYIGTMEVHRLASRCCGWGPREMTPVDYIM